jgi:MIP family channel proteins
MERFRLAAWSMGGLRLVLAEAGGTFLFFFVGIGAVLSLGANADPSASLIVVALAHGIVLAVLVSALGAVSGAHFNPAVTLGVWIAGHIPGQRALAYVLAQLIGGLLAAWSLVAVFPGAADFVGRPGLAETIDPVTGTFVEAVLTVILLVAVFGTAIDPRGPKVGGLVIGLALTADILMGGPLTGGAVNPARWFGPAAVTGNWDNGLVWIVGPLAGAAIAALAYRFIFLPQAAPERRPGMPDAETPATPA